MTKRRSLLMLAALALLAGWIASAWAAPRADQTATTGPSLPELLEKAIFTEETLGDLDAAIEIYQEILSRAQAERSYVAQAQLRLGMCYLKKGQKDEAVEALQRLVADFPSQKDLVVQARARLAELGVPLPGPGVTLRQVWAPATDIFGSPSRDGRVLSFVDWSTGDLAIHDFTTGRDRHLTSKGSWATIEYAEYSVISPDGKRIAYAWFDSEFSYGLRVADLDDFEPRVLHSSPETQWVRPVDWSPDGKQILAWFAKPDKTFRLVTVSVADGRLRELGSMKTGGDKAVFSPDGRLVAYAQGQSGDKPARNDVFLVPVNGGSPRTLVEHPANDLVLGWSPDGKRFLFGSDRTGRWGVWAMGITEGAPQGPPELLGSGLGELGDEKRFQPMGFTSDGTYYYGKNSNMRDIYLADLDPATGNISGSPTKATQLFEGSNSNPAWSRDGKQLAFVSQRDDAFVIVVRNLESGEDREVKVSPELLRVGRPHWSPDGNSFLVIGRDPPERDGLFRIDARTGAVSVLMRNNAETGYLARARLSPDGKVVYFQRHGGGGIFAYDFADKRERRLFDGQVGALDLSPDGKRLAFVSVDLSAPGFPRRVFLLSTGGGEPKEIFRWSSGGGQVPIAWAADGKRLILGKKDESRRTLPHEQPEIELWSLPAEGGEPRKLGLGMPGLLSVSMHPSGNRVALYTREQELEVWAIENFLPELQAKR